MKKLLFIIIIIGIGFSSCNNSARKEQKSTTTQTPATHHTMDATVYQCPMDPHIIKDEAGNCPICEMELEQKTFHEALMFLSDFKKENPDYKEGDDWLKEMKGM